MFDDVGAGVPVVIAPERCLNTRHHHADCRRCVDSCPTDAISIVGLVPAVVVQDCVHCGACTPVCPTDAVIGHDLPERRLMEACEELEAPALTLACAMHPNPSAFEASGVVVRHGRCLAALDIEQLLAASRNGQRRVSVDLSHCASCPLGVAAGASVVGQAEAANALFVLATGRSTGPISIGGLPGLEPARGDDDTRGSRVVESQRASMSRRGMFATLRRRATTAVSRSQEPPPPPLRRTRGPVPSRLPQHVPPSRRRLLDRLRAIAATSASATDATRVAADDIPFAAIAIDSDRCSGCELCARYCPTEALSFSSASSGDGATFALTLRAGTCIDCGICATACPEHAVSYGEEVTADSLTDNLAVTVAGGILVACAACGLPTSPTLGEAAPRCFSCRLGTGIVTALRDDAGLMADLIARTPADPEA